jgi:hypothetical protein
MNLGRIRYFITRFSSHQSSSEQLLIHQIHQIASDRATGIRVAPNYRPKLPNSPQIRPQISSLGLGGSFFDSRSFFDSPFVAPSLANSLYLLWVVFERARGTRV